MVLLKLDGACRRKQASPNLLYWKKLNLTWIKDCSIKQDTVNLIDEKMGNVFKLIGTEEVFLNRIPLAQAVRSTINSYDLMKLRSFCMTKDTIIWTKQQRTELEKIFTNYRFNRTLLPKIHKEYLKVSSNNKIRKWTKD